MYWKNVIAIAFRHTEVRLRVGETTSAGTKFDRVLNEIEFGQTSGYISGRKIDLILEIDAVNPKNEGITVELSNGEFKRNKNIRTSKSILGNILPLPSFNAVLGMDFVGISGYFFSCTYVDSVVVVEKIADVYIPGNQVDLDQFMKSDYEAVLGTLFTNQQYLVNQAEEINRKHHDQRRKRLATKKADDIQYLPPTFYSPKR